MNDESRPDASSRKRMLAELGELIEALARRVPRVERLGEIRIAQEAAALLKDGETRIEQLRTAALDCESREAELADAVMADDGGPLRKK